MRFKNHVVFPVLVFLVIALCTLQSVQAQYTADGEGFPLVSPINIDSPINTTYAINHVTLNFTITSMFNEQSGSIIMTYSLDNKENVTIPTTTEFIPLYYTDSEGNQQVAIQSYYLISGSVELKDLQSGQHSLTVFGQYKLDANPNTGVDSQTINFIIEDSEPPTNIMYATVGILTPVGIVVCALFAKRGLKVKNMHNTN